MLDISNIVHDASKHNHGAVIFAYYNNYYDKLKDIYLWSDDLARGLNDCGPGFEFLLVFVLRRGFQQYMIPGVLLHVIMV